MHGGSNLRPRIPNRLPRPRPNTLLRRRPLQTLPRIAPKPLSSRLLMRAEAAFRTLKSPLGERPIFHHKEGRVEAHIFLCVLAYHLLISIEKTLLDAGVHTSWATVRETLKTHQVNTVVLPTDGGLVLRIRRDSTPEPAHRELYQQLGISSEIM